MNTALAFARHGHAVFPVCWPVKAPHGRAFCSCGRDGCKSPAKHPHSPIAKNGVHSATTDSGVIKHWFGYLVQEANLGVVTDRLVVVDVDPRHDGDDSYRQLVAEHGEFPNTWRTLTGGGGEHIIYACPERVEVGCVSAENMQNPPLGPGIDIRARNGYIVAPPSKHMSGSAYVWNVDLHPHDTELAPAPDWLIERLRNRASGVGPNGDGSTPGPLSPDVWSDLTYQPISEYRDMAAARLAGYLFRHYLDFEAVCGIMYCWNAQLCRPPIARTELDQIIARIARRELARREAAS